MSDITIIRELCTADKKRLLPTIQLKYLSFVWYIIQRDIIEKVTMQRKVGGKRLYRDITQQQQQQISWPRVKCRKPSTRDGWHEDGWWQRHLKLVTCILSNEQRLPSKRKTHQENRMCFHMSCNVIPYCFFIVLYVFSTAAAQIVCLRLTDRHQRLNYAAFYRFFLSKMSCVVDLPCHDDGSVR